jgi:hypothetical protein
VPLAQSSSDAPCSSGSSLSSLFPSICHEPLDSRASSIPLEQWQWQLNRMIVLRVPVVLPPASPTTVHQLPATSDTVQPENPLCPSISLLEFTLWMLIVQLQSTSFNSALAPDHYPGLTESRQTNLSHCASPAASNCMVSALHPASNVYPVWINASFKHLYPAHGTAIDPTRLSLRHSSPLLLTIIFNPSTHLLTGLNRH